MDKPHKLTTGTDVWQAQSWDYAKAGEAFEVASCATRHDRFFDALRLAYDYRIVKDGSTVRCIPPAPGQNT